MSVQVVLGMGLDGPLMTPLTPAVGQLKTGPTGFLGWLEGQLGLEQPPAGFTERVLQYLACLRRADNPQRFFHRSLEVDEIGVARQLLSWRDAWYLAGWRGQSFEGGSDRLRDLAEVEEQAATEVLAGEGQRLQKVAEKLASVRLPVTVEHLDPLELFPHTWQQVLAQLETVPAPEPRVEADPDTDLGRLQALLLSGELPSEPQPLKGDGSLLVIEAPSRALSAEWLAHYYRQALPLIRDDSLGLLCDGPGDALDLAFAQAGVGRLAVSDSSPWRPAFQVLPLALELLWSPLNPARLLEFLSHPVGPLPRRIRQPLAQCVAEYPGMGGPEWQETVDQLIQKERERCTENSEADSAEQALRETLDYWLAHQRYEEHPGAPLGVVLERCQRVNDWVAGRVRQLSREIDERREAHSEEANTSAAELALYQRVLNQTRELRQALQALEAQGKTEIDADNLRRLVKSVRGQGAERPDVRAERGEGSATLMHARVPPACLGPVEQLIWWGADRATMPSTDGWTHSEQRALAASSVHCQPLDEQLCWQADSWLRPICATRGQLVWLVHEDAGEHHPVFDHIQALVSGLPTESLWSWLQGQNSAHLPQAPVAEPHAVQRLPERTRQWRLGAEAALPKRDTESYSSLESFIYGPYLWVLRYLAQLRPGSLLALSDEGRLKGNLAHRLFENYFIEHPDIPRIDVDAIAPWCAQQLPELLNTEGASLWLPGKAAERERFNTDVTAALERLVVHLQSADVVSVAMETRAEGLFVGGKLIGSLDLLARCRSGYEAVIDIKWGGLKYRREALQKSHYLQLALYAKLREAQTQSLPAVGYYIVNKCELLMLDSDRFPQAESIQPKNGETLLEFWRRFELSWKQRRAQLDQGQIEVAVSGTDPAEGPDWNEQYLPLLDKFESFSEFNALVGWEQDA